jgi:branched-chain amino acid transport system substrate-binding protein
METRFRAWLPLALAGALALLLAACAGGAPEGTPTKPPITIGATYDATGATANVGVPLKTGWEDYINLVNSKGGVDGHPINLINIEHGYEVPKGVDAYEQVKRQGAVMFLAYGTPIVAALSDRCNADKIPCLTPGFGIAAAANGEKYPYIFPMAASYWSQAGAAVKFILDQWQKEGRPGKPKIAYLYYDNPAGREPLEVLRSLAQREGFELREFAVPAPGLEQTAQVQDIVNRYRADWVIAHTFGRSPTVTLKTLKEVGYPLNRTIGFVWASTDEHIRSAGGWDAMEGYYGLHFTNIGADIPILQEIRRMYEQQGKAPHEFLTRADDLYIRGLAIGAMMVEGVRNALEKHGYPLDGTKVKEGLESIRGDLSGLITLRMSPQDHEGSGLVRIFQVRGGRWQPATDWFSGYREVVNEFLRR